MLPAGSDTMAYDLGHWIGRALPLVLGLALLLVAVQRHRAAERHLEQVRIAAAAMAAGPRPAPVPPAVGQSVPQAPWDPAPLWEPLAPVERRAPWSTGLLVSGSLLLAFGVLALVVAGVQRADSASRQAGATATPFSDRDWPAVHRTFAFPARVLGMDRDEIASEAVRKAMAPDATTGAVYAGGSGTIGVYALTSVHHSDLKAALADFRRDYNQTAGTALDSGTEVAPGPLGGAARCWRTPLQDSPAAICVFAESSSLLVVMDTGASEIEPAVVRAREVRAASEH